MKSMKNNQKTSIRSLVVTGAIIFICSVNKTYTKLQLYYFHKLYVISYCYYKYFVFHLLLMIAKRELNNRKIMKNNLRLDLLDCIIFIFNVLPHNCLLKATNNVKQTNIFIKKNRNKKHYSPLASVYTIYLYS